MVGQAGKDEQLCWSVTLQCAGIACNAGTCRQCQVCHARHVCMLHCMAAKQRFSLEELDKVTGVQASC